MEDTAAARRWRALVDAHAASGLTNRAFAAQHDINPRTLAWWRSRLRRTDGGAGLPAPAPRFAELVVAEPDRGVVLSLDGYNARVVIDHGTDLGLLRRVLEALT